MCCKYIHIFQKYCLYVCWFYSLLLSVCFLYLSLHRLTYVETHTVAAFWNVSSYTNTPSHICLSLQTSLFSGWSNTPGLRGVLESRCATSRTGHAHPNLSPWKPCSLSLHPCIITSWPLILTHWYLVCIQLKCQDAQKFSKPNWASTWMLSTPLTTVPVVPDGTITRLEYLFQFVLVSHL